MPVLEKSQLIHITVPFGILGEPFGTRAKPGSAPPLTPSSGTDMAANGAHSCCSFGSPIDHVGLRPITRGRPAMRRPLGWFCSRLLKTFSDKGQVLQRTILDLLDEIKDNLTGDYSGPSQSERRRNRRLLQNRPPTHIRTAEPQSPRRTVTLAHPSRLRPSNPSAAVRDIMAQWR